MKKYIPEIMAGLLITGLCLALWTQTNRLKSAQNETQAVQLEFDRYRVEQQEEVQRERHAQLERFTAALTSKESENENLQNQIMAMRSDRDNANRLLNAANARLRQARENANRGTCEDSREAARMCADLYGKLEERAREAERRASIYAQFADRNSIELNACRTAN